MRQPFWTLLCITISFCLSACARAEQVPITEPTGTTVGSPTPTVISTSAPTPTAVILPVDPPRASPSPVSTVSPTPTTAPVLQICSPLEIHPLEELPEITSDPYRPPPPGREERHHGVDFSYYRRGERTTIQGVGVQAVLPGRAAASIPESYPYGNVLIIETTQDELGVDLSRALGMAAGESLYTLYAHLDHAPLVAFDQMTESCQLIGAVGKSGNAFEPHLHLEMRLGPAGQSFRVMAYYGAKDSEEERQNYLRWRTGGEFRHFDPMKVLTPGEIAPLP